MDLKKQFPILGRQVNSKRLVYLDSAATCLKPLSVIEAERSYELEYCANIHRGIHTLSEQATKEFESTRLCVQKFINANSAQEIIFTKGTTESINLVAATYGDKFLKEGDEIWISSLEHHANIVPWQILCEKKGCVLKVIDLEHTGDLDFSKKSKLLAISYASNALGIKNPIKNWIKQAKANNMRVLIDAAQAVPHSLVDVQDLDCDFLTFSAHKMYGPTGVGILYAKAELLEQMPPYQTGGDMIEMVTFEKSTFAKGASKFEAGTPNISGVIGLHAAIKFMDVIRPDLEKHEANLRDYAFSKLGEIPGFVIPGLTRNLTIEQMNDRHPIKYRVTNAQLPIITFKLKNAHPHDIASILDQEGIAVRAGHMCAMPLMKLLGVPALTRASLAAYNTKEDLDALYEAILRVKQVLKC